MRQSRSVPALALASLTILLNGCGGGSSSLPAATTLAKGNAPMSIRILVPATGASTSAGVHHRRPNFVASTTAGVLVQVYAQSDTQHANLLSSVATDITSGSSACAGQTGSPRTCTIAFNAPSGSDTLVVTSYDAAPVGGSFSGAKQLAAASVNKTISASSANSVSITLGGVPNSLSVVVVNQQLRGTVSSTENIFVEAYDADTNLILTDGYVDASGNPVPITLQISPNTGSVFTLGSTSLSAPSPAGVSLQYNGAAASAFTATITATAGTLHATGTVALLGPTFTEFNATTAASQPTSIAIAPYSAQNGNLWFTESATNKIASVSPSGTITEYSAFGTQPLGIAPGPLGDTHLWYTGYGSSTIGAIDTGGVMYGSVNTPTAASGPYGIVAGPDGKLWFTEKTAGKIGKITTSFTFTEYTIPTAASAPADIAAGPDGNLWFVESGANKIGKITTTGTITEYAIPTASSTPLGIVAGADGRLWFTESGANKIAAITTSGTITEYAVPTASSQPQGITAGPDGSLWFVEFNGQKIGKITTTGTISEYAYPTAGSVSEIVAGPDDNLWFTETSANKIGKFSW